MLCCSSTRALPAVSLRREGASEGGREEVIRFEITTALTQEREEGRNNSHATAQLLAAACAPPGKEERGQETTSHSFLVFFFLEHQVGREADRLTVATASRGQ
jgi:hypothetical protein